MTLDKPSVSGSLTHTSGICPVKSLRLSALSDILRMRLSVSYLREVSGESLRLSAFLSDILRMRLSVIRLL